MILSKIMPRLKEDYLRRFKKEEAPVLQPVRPSKNSNGVVVEGIADMQVKFAQCCNPLPGDEIIGFVTRGHGVSIHKKDCVNVRSSMADETQRDRWLNAHFESTAVPKGFRSTLDIVAHDRNALLADISLVLANFRVPLHELNARELKNGNADIVVTFGVQGAEQLSNIIKNIGKVEGVISVERSGK